MKILFLALSLLALLNPAKSDETLRLGGYLESSINYFDGRNEVTSSNALFRLEGNYDIKNKGKIESHLLYHYDMKPLDPFHTFKDKSIYSRIINKYYQEMYDGLEMEDRIIADRLLEIYSSGYFDHLSYSSFYPKETIVLDRALIKLYYDSFDITFGKQQIAWGTGYALLAGGNKKFPLFSKIKDQLPSMPQAPTPAAPQMAAQAEATRRKKASARTSTVQTSPLGVAGDASIVKKTLLGL